MTEPPPIEISPQEVKQRMAAGENLRIIDVREPFEFQQARIEGSELIPMGSVPQALPSLEDSEALLVVLCHHGIRSLRVTSWLREHGVERCCSMAGGIDRWSIEVDPRIPRYS
ncbi:MAG: rhodanese-like domain-containing protein [Bryobacteraceae bacterium]